MGGTDINYPAQQPYGESMREALQAQIDLAKPLYEAEASREYGRPAYAQLETDILRDALLGQERFVPTSAGAAGGTGELLGGNTLTNYLATMDQAPETRQATQEETLQALFGADGWAPEGWEWVDGDFGSGRLQRVGIGQATQGLPGGATTGNLFQDAGLSAIGGALYQPTQVSEGGGQGGVAQGNIQRGGGLLDLLGGTGRQDYGTGAITQEFVTREATEDDVSAGTARYVGQEIQDGRVRDGQMIGETRDVLQSQTRRPGYSPEGEFMGLAQYGSDIAEQAARRQRSADIADVQRLGGIASQAIREADPLSAGLLGTMGEQATEGLAAGQDLTQRERERAIKDARTAWEARGRLRDPGAVVSELENLESARRAREAQRRAFATQTMQASRAMTADPFMAILGRPSGASQQIATQGLGGAQYGLSSGPQLYNPEAGLSYMLGQQTNQANLQAAQAGARGGLMGGLLGAGGSILGGMASGGTGFFK